MGTFGSTFGDSLVHNGTHSNQAPTIIRDGNTMAWYLPELALITKDSSSDVSVVVDKLGSGHDLVQATAYRKPKISKDGFIFYGHGHSLKSATFPYSQPETIYIVVKSMTWANLSHYFDGFASYSGFVRQDVSSPSIDAGGGNTGTPTDFVVKEWGIISVILNGVNSKIYVNGILKAIWNCGTLSMNGITLGSHGSGTARFGNFMLAEAIFRKGDDSSNTNLATFHSYLSKKHTKKLSNVIDCSWERKGVVLDGAELSLNNVQEPNVLYTETDSVIVGNPCFQLWYSRDTTVGYAESKDGITWVKYTGNPIISNIFRVCVRKYDGVYYLYNQGHTYTGTSPVNFTQIINTSVVKANIHVVKDGANWHQIYDYPITGPGWGLAYATSTDGINWTDQVKPLITKEDGTVGSPWFFRANDNKWYMWCHKANYGGIPTELIKYSSTDLINWEIQNFYELERLTVDEGINNPDGQVADPTLIEVNGVVYMYYSAISDQDPINGKIKLVISNKSLNEMAQATENVIIGTV